MGATETNSVCTNGTGVTLVSTNVGFEISSDNISFSGGSNRNASGSTTSSGGSPAASQTAKSGADFIQISSALFAGVVFAAIALMQ